MEQIDPVQWPAVTVALINMIGSVVMAAFREKTNRVRLNGERKQLSDLQNKFLLTTSDNICESESMRLSAQERKIQKKIMKKVRAAKAKKARASNKRSAAQKKE